MTRPVLGNEDEQDAFTGWRRVYHWHKGELRLLKRRASKRDRRKARQEIRDGYADD